MEQPANSNPNPSKSRPIVVAMAAYFVGHVLMFGLAAYTQAYSFGLYQDYLGHGGSFWVDAVLVGPLFGIISIISFGAAASLKHKFQNCRGRRLSWLLAVVAGVVQASLTSWVLASHNYYRTGDAAATAGSTLLISSLQIVYPILCAMLLFPKK